MFAGEDKMTEYKEESAQPVDSSSPASTPKPGARTLKLRGGEMKRVLTLAEKAWITRLEAGEKLASIAKEIDRPQFCTRYCKREE